MYNKAAVIETNGDMPEALNIGFAALEIAIKANLLLRNLDESDFNSKCIL